MYMPKILKRTKDKGWNFEVEYFIYTIIFIIGTLFGSFFTLAVYRIPLGKNITYEHSFCPNCNTKLKFIDLIPIISYITLGGRCRYCGEKVRIRYLLLEILSGICFVLLALSLKINFASININEIIYFLFLSLYISTLLIIAGIDKEKIKIQKSVIVFGLILAVCSMVYVCISKMQVIYTYIIFLSLTILMLILDTIYLKKNLLENYTISVLLLSLYMIMFKGAENFYYTVALALLIIVITMVARKIKERNRSKNVINTDKKLELPLGFYMVISNITVLLIANFLK